MKTYLYLLCFSLVALYGQGQKLTFLNQTPYPLTAYLEVMSRYKDFQVIDSFIVKPQSNVVIERKKHPVSFFNLKVSGKQQSQITFIWDNEMKVILDTTGNLVSANSALTNQWVTFEALQINPLRSQLMQNTIEANKRIQAGDTIGAEVQRLKTDALVRVFNKALDSLIFSGQTSFINFYLLAGRWNAWPRQTLKQQLERYSSNWANHPLMKEITDEMTKTESFGEGVRIKSFKKKTILNTELNLSTIKSEYILLDFWGSWCGPCLKAIPELKSLYSNFDESRLKIVGIAGENTIPSQAMRDIIAKKEIHWDQIEELRQGHETLAQAFNITFYPTYFLLDRNLKIIKRGDSRILPEVQKILSGK
ncbi:redoxin domain-containing protein [Runella sp. CRIBMP]|uniref:TlpA family protein disulfide reductase n=1 Tax=Runella sp. CRIBMP TaxID=2683261 RepID=UPI001412F5CC|nr:TlpA disulfide reductase family protein [Runella sp. CRIBMP]NBB23012.1 redoxin domain-containing protein [Runella sp. CRIBMP]